MQSERPLSARREVILRALVEEYVRSGAPVASKPISDQLARVYGGGYASATVRTELAALEEDGLIYQPHVSAGRMPTDLGYRYFVERLMRESQLTLDEQRLIGHQFFQVQNQLDEWVRLTASIMAQALQSAAIITQPRSAQVHLKHFEMLALHESVALVVLVLHDGTVRQERVMLETPAGQDELSHTTQRLNALLHGATAPSVGDLLAQSQQRPASNERVVLESLQRMLERPDLISSDAFYHDGIAHLLQRYEFAHADADRIRKVVEVLEQDRLVSALAPQVMSAEGVQVFIGSENASDALRDMSVVVSRYGGHGQLGGLLGIVGPTRMQYGRAIALVRYMTQVLNDLLADTYGDSDEGDDG